MTQAEFAAYVQSRKDLGMNRRQIAKEIGIGHSMLFEYLSGGYPVPRKVELLVRAAEAGLTGRGDSK